jgi:hypothetical protein
MLNTSEANEYKREAMDLLHEEAMRSFKRSDNENTPLGSSASNS